MNNQDAAPPVSSSKSPEKPLEYSCTGFTLRIVMNPKSIIALLMGLMIQLSQVPSCLASESTKTCGTQAHPAGCCEGLESCPCAENSDSTPKPAPLIPAAVDLKWLIPPAPAANECDPVASPPADVPTFCDSSTESRSGFAGVPLSVAFCSFVI